MKVALRLYRTTDVLDKTSIQKGVLDAYNAADFITDFANFQNNYLDLHNCRQEEGGTRCDFVVIENPTNETFPNGNAPTTFPALAFIDINRSHAVTFLTGRQISSNNIKNTLLRLWKYEWNGTAYELSEQFKTGASENSPLPDIISSGEEFKAGLPFGLGLFNLNLPSNAWLFTALLTGAGATQSKGITKLALGGIAVTSAVNYINTKE